MKAQAFLMARSATVGPEGQYSIQHLHDEIVFEFPPVDPGSVDKRAIWPNFVAVVALECAPSEGADHTTVLRVVDADERDVHPPSSPMRVHFHRTDDGRPYRVVQNIEVEKLNVPCPGDYKLVLLVDGVPQAEFAFYALEAK